MYEKELKEIGLNKNEVEIYLILLKIGELTIYEIANHSSISRPNIYDIVKKLRKKGLVTSLKKSKKTYYSVTEPKNLLNLLDEKRKNLINVLPKIEQIFSSYKDKTLTEIYSGADGLKLVMEDMLNSEEILIFNGVDIKKVLSELSSFDLERYLKEKKRKKIKTKILYSEFIQPVKGAYYFYKKLPSNMVLSNVSYWVYSDRVVLGIWSTNPLFIKIISKDVADTFRENINFIWKNV